MKVAVATAHASNDGSASRISRRLPAELVAATAAVAGALPVALREASQLRKAAGFVPQPENDHGKGSADYATHLPPQRGSGKKT